ncbi:MAG: DUF1761 domain-containing protein [Terracidiphilus sp.]
MHHIFHDLNYLAIFVSAVILWLLGAVWYSPALFAKPWMAIIGIKKEETKGSSMIAGMIASFICDLVLAFILAHIVIWTQASTLGWGAVVGFIVWTGFIAAPNLPQGIYEGRPFKLFAINAGYWLVGLLIVGALLAVWR